MAKRLPSRQVAAVRLAELARQGQITEREEALFEQLAELEVLSLDHIHRLLWAEAEQVTAYQRLAWLVRHGCLQLVPLPPAEMAVLELAPGLVYRLGPGGRLWLKPGATLGRFRPLPQVEVLERLRAAELYVRLVEAIRQRGSAWRLRWTGQAGLGGKRSLKGIPLLSPLGLGVLWPEAQPAGAGHAFFLYWGQVEVRPNYVWTELVRRYDRWTQGHWSKQPYLHQVQIFPAVCLVLPTVPQRDYLAAFINRLRTQPVRYYLAAWPELVFWHDILDQPVWRDLTSTEPRSLLSRLQEAPPPSSRDDEPKKPKGQWE